MHSSRLTDGSLIMLAMVALGMVACSAATARRPLLQLPPPRSRRWQVNLAAKPLTA